MPAALPGRRASEASRAHFSRLRGLSRTCTFLLVIRSAMGEEIHVDFNTGSGGSGGLAVRLGGVGARPRVSGGASGGDFDYRDPVQSFIRRGRSVFTAPVGFFRGIRREGDFLNPLIFAIICSLSSAILGLSACSVSLGVYGSRRAFGSFLVSADPHPDLRRHRPVHQGRHLPLARDSDRQALATRATRVRSG